MELFKNKDESKDCKLDMGRGCEFCSCGEEGASAKVCDGCFKLHVTDWLKDYPENLPGDIFEVRFKNTRRGYYHNVNNLPLCDGDIVAVEASPGHDIGIVSLSGDMVSRQMRRIGFNPQNGEFKKIYRKAKPYDIEKWQEAIALEHPTMIKSRQIAAEMNLNMKIGDVEYQGDKIKAIFYYIADERVDFRELIKVFADVFRIRIEMKQIGARQEAGRIGGIGSCGRELCCASWISSFLSVTTNAARMQDISLNPQKLAGQCSKLKCCLIYEYDDYMDARKEFPKVNEPLYVMDGEYYFVKNDILGRTMSFSTAPGSMAGLVELPIARVREIQKLNAKGIKPEKLESTQNRGVRPEVEPDFVNVIGEDSITRFDSGRKKNRKGKGGNESRDWQPRQPRERQVVENGEQTNQSEKGDNSPNIERRQNGGRNDQRSRNNNGQRQNGNGGRTERQGNNKREQEQQGNSEHSQQGERQENTQRSGSNTNRQQRHEGNYNRQKREGDNNMRPQRPSKPDNAEQQPNAGNSRPRPQRPPRPDNQEGRQGGEQRANNEQLNQNGERRQNNKRRGNKPVNGGNNGGGTASGSNSDNGKTPAGNGNVE